MTNLKLISMTETEYAEWLPRSRENFALAKMKGQNMTREEAESASDKAYRDLLPLGLATPDHYLFMAKDQNKILGFLWLCSRGPAENRKAYIYDVEIYETFRGQGYGRSIMRAAEEKARQLGLKHIGLHVFGYNEPAIQLYRSLDYKTTGITMEKSLI